MTAGLALFTVANGLVAASSLLGVSLLRLDGILEKLLAGVTIALSQIVLSLLVAGVLAERLTPGTIIALNGAIFVALAAATRATGRGSRLRFGGRERLRPAWNELVRTPWLAALLALVTVQVVWRLLAAYVLPPSGFDPLWYHLTTVAWWLQEEQVTTNPLTIWSSVHPANGELFFTWLAVFVRDDAFLDVVQLGFGLVGSVAVAGIARVAGLGRSSAAATGAVFFLSPVVLAQSSSSYVDLIFVSTFLVAFYWVLRAFMPEGRSARAPAEARSPDPRRLLLAGLAGGVALGSKAMGILYCGVLAVVVVIWLVRRLQRGDVGPGALPVALSSFMLPMLALGAYWYVRNWSVFGNPVYPARVAVGGLELFGGRPLAEFLSTPDYTGSWWKEILWQWHQDHVPFAGFQYYGVGSQQGGLGPLWSYLMLPALIFFVIRAARRRELILITFFLPLAVIFALQPYRWWSRFTMVLLAAGAIALLAIVERLPRRTASTLGWVSVALVLLGTSYSTPTKSVLSRLGQPRHERTIGDVVAPWFRWVDDVEAPARIAVDATEPSIGAAPEIWFFYPLFGSRFENEVVPLQRQGLARMRAELAAQEIHYVVVGARGPYSNWARAEVRAGCFQDVFADEHARVYRRVPECTSGPGS